MNFLIYILLNKNKDKLYFLTGDKVETAINISSSCRHFSPDMKHLIMNDLKEKSEIEKILTFFSQQ